MTDTYNQKLEPASPVPHLTPGMAGETCFADFLDEDRCRRWIINSLYPSGPRCPHCRAAISGVLAQSRFYENARRECKSCGRWFSATVGTFLQGTRLSFTQVYLLARLAHITQPELSVHQIAAAVDVSPDTIRIWKKRFKLFND